MQTDIALNSIADAIREFKEALDALDESPTPQSALDVCLACRQAFYHFVDLCLDGGMSPNRGELTALLERAFRVLAREARKNETCSEFLLSHSERAKEALDLAKRMGHGPPPRRDQPVYVFLSYMHENQRTARKLCQALKDEGIIVWFDQQSLRVGRRWKARIKQAIKDGDRFVALFSRQYSQRPKNYMQRELRVALEVLQNEPFDSSWFVPVVLPGGSIPPIEISACESLNDIQYLKLSSRNWQSGVAELVSAIRDHDETI